MAAWICGGGLRRADGVGRQHGGELATVKQIDEVESIVEGEKKKMRRKKEESREAGER